jgi:hypothetical protein
LVRGASRQERAARRPAMEGGALGLQRHGPANLPDSPLKAAVLEVQDAEQVQRVGVVRLLFHQRAIAAGSVGETVRLVQLLGCRKIVVHRRAPAIACSGCRRPGKHRDHSYQRRFDKAAFFEAKSHRPPVQPTSRPKQSEIAMSVFKAIEKSWRWPVLRNA